MTSLSDLKSLVDATFAFIEQKVKDKFSFLAPVIDGFLNMANQQIDSIGLQALATYLEDHGIAFPIPINHWIDLLFSVIEEKLSSHKIVVMLLEMVKTLIESVGTAALLKFLQSQGLGNLVTS